MWIEKDSPFEVWRNRYLAGMAVSQDILKMMAMAFDGGQADMKEKCAKLCDELVNDENSGDYANAAKWCAIRIRAIGDSHE